MDSILSLFRINMATLSSESIKSLCDVNSILKNYDLVTGLDRVSFRDLSSNTANPITQVRLKINSIDDIKNKLDPNAIQQQLLQDVSQECSKYKLADIIDLHDTPWFECWKDRFMDTHCYQDHDFIGSNFGVFILLSMKDLQSFDSIAQKLLHQSRDDPALKFMTNNPIEHYVVINTESDGCHINATSTGDYVNSVPSQYVQLFTKFVNCFGHNNCSWLNLISEDPSTTHNIVAFLKNFIASALVPWCERQVRILNDAISTRRGLRRNLVIATRQLLNIGQAVNQTVFYTSDAGEMKCRKLGDIAMSLGLYELAANSYDLAKKEFLNDGAWLYYAGACEAHAAAMFMLSKFQRHHIDKAVSTYMDPCKNLVLATRATILATDILKRTYPLDAAKFFITLTGNDNDLQSALFLEQASKCYVQSRSRLRKASFYYVLAAYRFSRCNLGNLSLRCYSQFNAKEWVAAHDYVQLSSKHIMDQYLAPSQPPESQTSMTTSNVTGNTTSQQSATII